MAFDPERLTVQLNNTGLQNKDNPLYQLIYQIIKSLGQLFLLVNGGGGSGGGGGSTTIINNNVTQQLLLNPDSGSVGSDSLLMGIPSGIIPPSEFVEWSVLTNGDADFPELVFAGGDVIMTHTP